MNERQKDYEKELFLILLDYRNHDTEDSKSRVLSGDISNTLCLKSILIQSIYWSLEFHGTQLIQDRKKRQRSIKIPLRQSMYRDREMKRRKKSKEKKNKKD